MKFPNISKTTMNGALAFVIAAATWATTQPDLHLSPTVAGYIALVAGFARMAVGFLQVDADRALAVPAGKSEPEIVPAHPQPDDPTAKPVLPQTKS